MIKQRDLAELAQLRRALRKLENRFNEKRSNVEERLRRGADIEAGRHWVWLRSVESMDLMLDE